MINENTLNFIRFSSGFNSLKKEELEAFAENEIFELNEYNASEGTQGKYFYTLKDVNTNGTLKSYIIECLKLSLQTRWGNNLEYHIDRKTKYLNKLTGMQA